MFDNQADRPSQNPWTVVLPMAAVLLLMAGFFWITRFLPYCEIYPYLVFAYPLIFGTAGVVLGGQISVQGNFIEPFPWAIKAGAGVGAALVGFLIAFNSQKPACNEQQYTISITDLPSAAPSPRSSVQTIVIPEYEPNIGAIVQRVSDSKRDFQFTFDAKKRFELLLHVMRLEKRMRLENGTWKEEDVHVLYSTCKLAFEIIPSPKMTDESVIRIEGPAPRFAFDKSYVQRQQENKKNGQSSKFEDKCLTADVSSATARQQPISPPFYVEAKAGQGVHVVVLRDENTSVAKSPDIPDPDASSKPTILATAEPKKSAIETPLPPALIEQLEARKKKPAFSSAESLPTPMPTIPDATKQVTEPKPASPVRVPGTEAAIPKVKCTGTPADSELLRRFIEGDELDFQTRKTIYADWENAHCYVLSILFDAGKSPVQRARALRLMTYGLANIDDRLWQPGGRSYRDFRKPIPLLEKHEEDFIFSLTQSDSDPLREHALRFVRTLPANSIEERIRKAAETIDSTAQPKKERLAITASYFYYNRIAEYLNDAGSPSPAEQAMIREDIARNAARAAAWTKDSLFTNGNASAYRAMVAYAMAIVEREKKLTVDAGRGKFAKMLEELRASSEGYPSNFLHIGQALAFTDTTPGYSQAIMDRVKKAQSNPPAFFLDERIVQNEYADLFSGPGDFTKIKDRLKLTRTIRVLMQHGDWDLILGNGHVGWMKRQPTKAAFVKGAPP